ncbi:DUF413 domain-containing protein [Shewanella metallivivens]|uniref:Macrodomain Ori protein n=1 Tax=Shewanella metallivivens TaxID=2872342 RepID=A0ABT5TIY0_9GAMM|nr:DUF413 domain-containing protein [Shewanella metallivivens]MDD8058551.1 DUF413 domain-containing protein [Shewanella metallivivens]
MSEKSKHKALIGKPPEDMAHLGYLFTERERSYLNKYGAWLDALANSRISPITAKQSEFLKSVRCEKQPKTEAEVIWAKWSKAREELLQKRAAARSRRENEESKNMSSISTKKPFSFICNACGSNSPNLCRCSE